MIRLEFDYKDFTIYTIERTAEWLSMLKDSEKIIVILSEKEEHSRTEITDLELAESRGSVKFLIGRLFSLKLDFERFFGKMVVDKKNRCIVFGEKREKIYFPEGYEIVQSGVVRQDDLIPGFHDVDSDIITGWDIATKQAITIYDIHPFRRMISEYTSLKTPVENITMECNAIGIPISDLILVLRKNGPPPSFESLVDEALDDNLRGNTI